MRIVSSFLLIFCLAGCHRGVENNDAVRQGVLDYLATKGMTAAAMDINVSAVKFNGDKADATVSFAAKGTGAGQMAIQYHLEQKDNKWVVVGRRMRTSTAARLPGGAAVCGCRAGQSTWRGSDGSAGSRGQDAGAGRSAARRQKEMKRVAILGGGPAGAFAAEKLASAGLGVVLMDEKLAWEKPCGGGLTHKAYSQYPFLIENSTPEADGHGERAGGAEGGRGDAEAGRSAGDLFALRPEQHAAGAGRAGGRADREDARDAAWTRQGAGWRLQTAGGKWTRISASWPPARAIRCATWGRSCTPPDTMSALGYYVQGEQAQIDIQFLPDLEGYIWIFPRCGHLSVGICGKGEPASALRKRLEAYMAGRGISVGRARRSTATCCPRWTRSPGRRTAWRAMAGWRWATRRGLVDPITGEGLYYAMRSGDLAAQSLLADAGGPAESMRRYRGLLRRDFAADLEFGSRLAKRVFLGRFLFARCRSGWWNSRGAVPRFAECDAGLFAGKQPYLGLKRRLMRNLNGSLYEIAMSFGLGRMVPKARSGTVALRCKAGRLIE